MKTNVVRHMISTEKKAFYSVNFLFIVKVSNCYIAELKDLRPMVNN